MNAKTFLYKSLLNRLLNGNLTWLKRVEMFHRGVVDANGDYLPGFEGQVLVEFEPITWQNLGNKVQHAETRFQLHICSPRIHGTGSTEPDATINQGLQHLERADAVTKLITGFSACQDNGTGFGTISRTGNITESGQKAMLVDVLRFRTRLTDYNAKKTNGSSRAGAADVYRIK